MVQLEKLQNGKLKKLIAGWRYLPVNLPFKSFYLPEILEG